MEDFEFNFPVWAVGTGDADGIHGFAIVRITDPGRGSCLPIFTDTDLANRFVERRTATHSKEHHILKIENARSLGVIVGSLAQAGVGFVAVDFLVWENQTSAVFIAVEKVLETCQSYPAE